MTGKERKEIQTAYKNAVVLGHRLIIFRKDRQLFFAAKAKLLELFGPLNSSKFELVKDSLTDAAMNNLDHLCGLLVTKRHQEKNDRLPISVPSMNTEPLSILKLNSNL